MQDAQVGPSGFSPERNSPLRRDVGGHASGGRSPNNNNHQTPQAEMRSQDNLFGEEARRDFSSTLPLPSRLLSEVMDPGTTQ